MYAVPLMLESLPSDARAALSSCNRQLRQMLHDLTTTILLDDACHLQRITNGKWSNLALIVYEVEEGSFRWPRGGNLQMLARLNFSSDDGQLTGTYLIVSNKHADRQQQARLNSLCIAQAFDYMHNHLQQSFSRLEMSIRQGKLSAQIMAQLVKLNLPCLTLLDLDNNRLDAAAMAYLAQACWPMLDALYLTNTKLDATSAEHLAESNWPLLRILNLSCNQLDNTAMMHLGRAQWPELQGLCLKDNSFTEIGVKWLTEGRWQKLNDLTLDSRAACRCAYTICTSRELRLPAVSGWTRYVREGFTISRDLGNLAAPNRSQVVWPHLKEVHCVNNKRLHLAIQFIALTLLLITEIVLALALIAFYMAVLKVLKDMRTTDPARLYRILGYACVILLIMSRLPFRMAATIAATYFITIIACMFVLFASEYFA